MDAYAIHDDQGKIVSVAFMNTDELITVGVLPADGEIVTRITPPQNVDPQDSASLEALIRDYCVDVGSGRLVQSK